MTRNITFFLDRLLVARKGALVALKGASFSLEIVQSDVLSRSRFLLVSVSTDQQLRRRCFVICLPYVNEALLQVAVSRRGVLLLLHTRSCISPRFGSQPGLGLDRSAELNPVFLLQEPDCFTSSDAMQNASFTSQLFNSK